MATYYSTHPYQSKMDGGRFFQTSLEAKEFDLREASLTVRNHLTVDISDQVRRGGGRAYTAIKLLADLADDYELSPAQPAQAAE